MATTEKFDLGNSILDILLGPVVVVQNAASFEIDDKVPEIKPLNVLGVALYTYGIASFVLLSSARKAAETQVPMSRLLDLWNQFRIRT